ncbi:MULTISPECIES: YraN family protein [Rhodobacterales]|uniref:YraN family protein n=1 Tax=Roseobacter sp. N2S TaxID=2663844 RepID=UPI0028588347|nr:MULTISPECIES: YraN family protein [Rhodobacterales]MDR6263740.1 putative endonuclease [Roseobacter sp. N2S]
MDRATNGKLSYLKGQAAEHQIALAYERNGFEIVDRRWKSKDGEIDLVARHDQKLYFIEVKSSKTFDSAVQQITPRQQQRIHDCALQYLAEKAGHLDVDCRFDAALVDGTGRIKVLPGALLAA